MTTLTKPPHRKSNSPVLKIQGRQARAIYARKSEQIISRNASPTVYRVVPEYKSLREVSKKGLWSTLRRGLEAFRHLLAGPPMTDKERFARAVQEVRTEMYKTLGGGFAHLRPR